MTLRVMKRLLTRCWNNAVSAPFRPHVTNSRALVKLHLGCFDQIISGWINTDITPHIIVARIPGLAFLLYKARLLSQERYMQHQHGMFRHTSYLDVTKQFHLDDCTVDYVFCSHLLEHLHPDDSLYCLKEVFRILKPGGIFRIAVPDLDKIVLEYNSDGPEEFCERIFEAKQKRDKNRHRWHFNEMSLAKILRETGFHEVRRCKFGEGQCADVGVIDNRPGSLFMEAEKQCWLANQPITSLE